MAKGIRWSDADLRKYAARPGVAAPFDFMGARTGVATPAPKLNRLSDVISSIATAIPEGRVKSGSEVSITWPGMKLLTLNEMLRIDHRGLHAYKHACHKAVRDAMIALSGKAGGYGIHCPVRVLISRTGLRLVDTDGLYASFKFLLDGFRFANVIRDDDPMNIIALEHYQGTGTPSIGVTIRAA